MLEIAQGTTPPDQAESNGVRHVPYVTRRANSDGGQRWYWQRPGCRLVRLPDDPVARLAVADRLNAEQPGRNRRAPPKLSGDALRMKGFLEDLHRRLVLTRGCNMTEAEFAAMMRRAGGRCELTRIPFTLDVLPGVSTSRRRPWSPSVDRIDPSRSYVTDNCRLVCLAVNLARNEYSDDVLMRIALALVSRASAPHARLARAVREVGLAWAACEPALVPTPTPAAKEIADG